MNTDVELPRRHEDAEEIERQPSLPGRRWWLAAIAIFIVAAGLRFTFLEQKPMHNDEGVNGNFTTQLFREGYYRYDPENYHGPSLYYLALIATKFNALFFGKDGLSTVALRIVPAIFGMGILWLILQLRRRLGNYGALGAAVLVAISPGAVYFSRYFIHEIPFALFTLAIVVAILRYYETTHAVYLMLASASVALLVATKETSVISLAVLALACGCAEIYLRGRKWLESSESKANARKSRVRAARGDDYKCIEDSRREGLLAHFGGRRKLAAWLVLAGALFLTIHTLLYSSFFTNFPKGIYDSVRTYFIWLPRSNDDSLHKLYTYFQWMWDEEMPSLLLGLAGIGWALYRGNNRFALFAAFWAMGIFSAYSLITYKTPWLTLNISIPFALMGGYLVQEVYNKARQSRRQRVKVALIGTAAALAAASLYQAIDISFFRYDDNSVDYVYAHTTRQIFLLLDKVNQAVARSGNGTQTGIMITAPDYWPLPWYLRDYPNAGYWGKVIPPTEEAVIIGEDSQEAELQRTLGDKYERAGSYELRPGAMLVVYVKK
jgi:uncharacterized protein (TIGR03663 family)